MAYSENNIDRIPGSYQLEELKLISFDGSDTDLDNTMIELNIYEDLFNNCITGKLLLHESFNFISNAQILEGDVVRMILKPNDRDDMQGGVDPGKLELELEIIRITDRILVKKDVNAYNLILASPGWTDNHFNRVSKSYSQKPYSDMVQDIFDNYLFNGGLLDMTKSKPLEIEGTSGDYSVVFPSWNPLKCVNFCANRSSDGAEVADWIFFDTPKTYKFVSINSLLSGPVKGTHYTQMANTRKPGLQGEKDERDYLNFYNFEYNDSGNILERCNNGLVSNDMVVYDFFNRKLYQYRETALPEADNYILKESYHYTEKFGAKEHVENNEPLVESIISDKFARTPGQGKKTLLFDHKFMYDAQDKGYEYDLYVRQHASQKEAVKFFKVVASGPGIFDRTVGDLIAVNLASPEQNNDGKPDIKHQGNYLITALRRMFTRTEHTMTMELVKDSWFSRSTDPFWLDGLEKKIKPRLPSGGNSSDE